MIDDNREGVLMGRAGFCDYLYGVLLEDARAFGDRR